MNTKELAIKYRRLDTIKPLPQNAKLHDLTGIMDSISTFGFIDPILVSVETDHDLDGNGRLEALKMLYAQGGAPPGNIVVKQERTEDSPKKVPVWYAPTLDATFDRETEPIVAMRLNRSHDKGGYDDRLVFNILEQAATFDRLPQTGFDQTIFEALALKYAPPPEFNAPGHTPHNGEDYGQPDNPTSDGANGQVTAGMGVRIGEQGAPAPLQPSYCPYGAIILECRHATGLPRTLRPADSGQSDHEGRRRAGG